MSEEKKPSEYALQKAASAWTQPTTSSKTMDTELAMEFAKILDEVLSKPWFGNATTKELLDELSARAEIGGYANYSTVPKIQNLK